MMHFPLPLKPISNGSRLSVSLVAPAYNEADLIVENVSSLYSYMQHLEQEYDWELIIVNDGSTDDTGILAENLAVDRPRMRVVHHSTNRNLGAALQTGFRQCKGDYVLVLDIDLSYGPDHIKRLLVEAVETDADIVVASPYMRGGKTTAIPFQRELLSRVINWMLKFTSKAKIHTFTSMVRVYKRSFLQNLNLKSNTYSINPEIINKATILRGRIREIPAHLDWSGQRKSVNRKSSIKIMSGIFAGLMTGFIFRPYAFFMTVGAILFVISIYIIGWIFHHTFAIYPEIATTARDFENAFSLSVAAVFQERSYSFLVGATTLILAFQFFSLGFISLQNKRYFDELFHLGSNLLKRAECNKDSDGRAE